MLNKIKRIAKNRVVWDKGSTQRSVAGDFYDTVCDALEDALEIITKLERVVLAAKDVRDAKIIISPEHTKNPVHAAGCLSVLTHALKELEKN